jgi:hypothetical protein
MFPQLLYAYALAFIAAKSGNFLVTNVLWRDEVNFLIFIGKLSKGGPVVELCFFFLAFLKSAEQCLENLSRFSFIGVLPRYVFTPAVWTGQCDPCYPFSTLLILRYKTLPWSRHNVVRFLSLLEAATHSATLIIEYSLFWCKVVSIAESMRDDWSHCCFSENRQS